MMITFVVGAPKSQSTKLSRGKFVGELAGLFEDSTGLRSRVCGPIVGTTTFNCAEKSFST
jgi:hypothetical protein